MPAPSCTPLRLALAGLAALVTLVSCSSGEAARPEEVAPTLVVQPDEIPDGWDAGPHDPRNDDFTRIAEAFDECVGVDAAAFPQDAVTAHSPDFSTQSGARQVKSTVNLVDERLARRAVDALLQPRSARCLSSTIREQLARAELDAVTVRTVSTATLTPAEVGARPGSRVAVLRTALGLTVGGVDIEVFLDNILLAEGPWFGRLFVLGTSEPPERELERAVVSGVQERMAEAADG